MRRHFDRLVKGVREMKRHVAGKPVRGTRVTELAEPDSQAQFAKLIGVNLRTLQNWEQHRTRPTGPARALLHETSATPLAGNGCVGHRYCS